MGWLDSIISGIFGVGQQVAQNVWSSNEAQKNRDFQSQEAEMNRIFQSNEAALQRDWSAQEAERARDWQEEMNAKYNSISGKIAQAEEAGVNPMFAVTGNAVSPASASGSVPSGASAGSVGTPAGATASSGLVNIIGELMNARKVSSEIDLMKSETRLKNAQALTSEIDNLSRDSMNKATIQSLIAQVRSSDASVAEKRANIGLISEKIRSEILNQDYIKSSTNLNDETATKVYQEAVKIFNEAESIAQDVSFKRDTYDDRKLSVHYDRLVKEFQGRLVELSMPEDDMHAVQNFFYKLLAILK